MLRYRLCLASAVKSRVYKTTLREVKVYNPVEK